MKRVWMKELFIAVMFVAFSIAAYSYAADEQKVFATWEGFEADKLASIWLIKRFITQDAPIIIVPKWEEIQGAIFFDTPQSRFKRTFNQSTFESFVDCYKIEDKKIHSIALIIHDIEINIWERKVFRMTREVETQIVEIIRSHRDTREIIEIACRYFDKLYYSIPERLEPGS